ncbi:MAG: TonB-dependent receptor [Caulobacter sp.]|nr:TonB-dependent receptor [Caulobacter sp.]
MIDAEPPPAVVSEAHRPAPELRPVPVEVVGVTVVASAGLPPRPADDAFGSVELDSETIATAPRVDEALTLVPGVQLFRRTSSAAANPTTQGMTVRAIAGSGAGRALVTLDGVPQNDPFGGWVLWSGLPPASIGDAIVVRGAGAGPYGAGALTGMVQLGEVRVVPSRGQYELFAGERGLAGGQAVIGFGDVMVVGAVQQTEGWTPVRKGRGAADAPLAFEASSLAIRWSPDLGEREFSLRLAGYQESRDSGLVGAASRSEGLSASATLTGDGLPVGDAREWRLQAWARASDFENSSVAVGAGRAFTTPANDQFGTPALGIGVNAAVRGEWGGGGWELGADVRYAEGETRERFRYIAGAFTRGRVAGGAQSVAGVYGEAWWYGQNSLSVTGGVRVDHWTSFDGRRLERDLVTDLPTLTVRPDDAEGWQPTARLGARKDFGSAFLRGAGYVGFRPPTLNELHRPFRVGNDITEANAGLEPETLYGLEFGAGGGDQGKVRWAATLFANRLESAVTNVTIGVGPGIFPVAGFVPAGGVLRQRQNAGDINAWGLEADVGGPWGARRTWKVAVAWTDSEVDGGAAAPQLTGLRPAQTPQLSASAESVWRPIAGLSIRSTLRYEGERFDDDLNLRRLAAAFTSDLRIDWQAGRGVTFYAAAENLSDAEVETGQTADGIESFDMPRTIRIGLIWRP